MRECRRHSLCYYDYKSGEVYHYNIAPKGAPELIPIAMVIYDREKMDNVIIKDSSYVIRTEDIYFTDNVENDFELTSLRKKRLY